MDLAILAFRQFQYQQFRGYMTRFAHFMRLRARDLPFGEEERREEEAEPAFNTERERQIYELKKMAKKEGISGARD